MTKVLRIVTLASRSGKYGGPFDTARRQAEIGLDAGFDMALIAGALVGDRPERGIPEIEQKFVPVRSWFGGGFATMLSFSLVAELWREIKRSDLAHISLAREVIPLTAVICCRLLRKPMVLQPHGMLTSRSSWLHRLIDRVMGKLTKRTSVWIALTPREGEDLRRLAYYRPGQIEILGNPVPPPPARVRSNSNSTILFAARLHPRKRVVKFIEAARCSEESGWSEKYVIAGPDEGDLPLVTRACDELGNLEYLGALPESELRLRLATSSAFVLPSLDEPWGNVLATAISYGVPAIVHDSAHLAPEIANYDAGIVVGDDSREIALAAHAVAHDEDLRLRLRRGCADFSREHLSREAQSRRLSEIYRMVADG